MATECIPSESGKCANPGHYFHVNEYKPYQALGGQEEGGWWYTAYEPGSISVPVHVHPNEIPHHWETSSPSFIHQREPEGSIFKYRGLSDNPHPDDRNKPNAVPWYKHPQYSGEFEETDEGLKQKASFSLSDDPDKVFPYSYEDGIKHDALTQKLETARQKVEKEQQPFHELMSDVEEKGHYEFPPLTSEQQWKLDHLDEPGFDPDEGATYKGGEKPVYFVEPHPLNSIADRGHESVKSCPEPPCAGIPHYE